MNILKSFFLFLNFYFMYYSKFYFIFFPSWIIRYGIAFIFMQKKENIFFLPPNLFFLHEIFFSSMVAVGQKNCFHETQMRDFQQIIWVNSNNLGYSFSLNGRKYTWEFSFERWAVMMLSYTWSCCSLLQALTVIGTLSEFVIFNASLSITS